MGLRCALCSALWVLAASEDVCSAAERQRFLKLVDEGNAKAHSDPVAALQKYEAALEIDGESELAANPLTNTAILLGRLGRHDEALGQLRRSVALNARSFHAHYSLGNALVRAQDWAGADESFRTALGLAPPGADISVRVNWANTLQRSVHYDRVGALAERDVIAEAYEVILPVLGWLAANENVREAHVVGIASAVLQKHGSWQKRQQLHRLAVERGIWQDARQRPPDFDWSFAKRGLSEPWWRGTDGSLPLPFLSGVAGHWRRLRKEVSGLLLADRLPSIRGNEEEELFYRSKGHDWRQLYVIRKGKLDASSAQIAPVTSGLFASTPLMGDPLNFVSLSVLMPGTQAEPHCGQTNARLTCHLPLKVPKGSSDEVGISVAGEARSWTEGEWLCFDDSFEHSVWNLTPEPRAVVVVNFRHPSLSDKH